ncbi:NAD(P)-dependent alcohol dehydrogenase [Bauldia sp.]|uniref:NAD(P)-dependent alcohol dehydrogenase n=1 Tax=Bauldia sp. TaxID=2575872 RepID=UPI003BAC15A8
MKALTYTRYGPPDVVEVADVPRPEPGAGDVLVRVHASAVNTGDWRIRAAAFPGVLAIPGRLMFGLLRPRNQFLGSEFAGVVDAVGASVTRFAPSDAVFGFSASGGASADYIAVPETSAIAPIPAGLDFDEAAALPFGGLCALVFLADFAGLHAGQTVLIVGASGGVGAYAIQIAKALGARVSGVAGSDSQDFIRDLGADVAIDYRTTDITGLTERFDVIFDTIGVVTPRQSRALLKEGGLFLPLNFGLREIGAALLNSLRDRKIRLAVNGDTAEDLARLADMVESGDLRPVIDTRYPLEDAARAHAHVETRHRKGAIVLTIAQPTGAESPSA